MFYVKHFFYSSRNSVSLLFFFRKINDINIWNKNKNFSVKDKTSLKFYEKF